MKPRAFATGRRALGATTAIALVVAFGLVAEAAPPKSLTGTWVFVRDQGGMDTALDARIKLVFTPDGRARLEATRGTTVLEDHGTFKYVGGRLSLALPETGIEVKLKKIEGEDPLITLPFKVFDRSDGQSVWKRAEPLDLRVFSSGKVAVSAAAPEPTAGGLAARLAKAKAMPPGAGTVSAPPAADGFSAPMAPPPPPRATAGSGPFAHLAGRWTGRALGAENRYRKVGSLGLYAKHVADYWFDVDATGVINGMVTIRYAVDVDSTGAGPEARVVAGFVEAWQKGGTGPDAAMIRFRSGLPTNIVTRTVPIKGYVDPARNELVIATIGDLGKLDYTYMAGGVAKVSPFPAWSPFLDGAGAKIRVAGSTYAGRSTVSGTDRKKPWKEYWFTWTATLSR